jgi:hypothetical protein
MNNDQPIRTPQLFAVVGYLQRRLQLRI